MRKNGNEKDYKKSKRVTRVMGKIKKRTQKYYFNLSQKENYKQEHFQKLADMILEDLKLPKIPITFGGRRVRIGKGYRVAERYGSTVVIAGQPVQIILYEKTKVKGKKVAVKTLIRTLLHEIIHVYDYLKLGLSTSPHTSGFYYRLGDLTKKLEGNYEIRKG